MRSSMLGWLANRDETPPAMPEEAMFLGMRSDMKAPLKPVMAAYMSNTHRFNPLKA